MALSQSDIDALEKALASGALRVSTPDSGMVEYRSVAELKDALAYAKSAITTQIMQSAASFCRD